MNFAKFLRKPFFKEHLPWLLLNPLQFTETETVPVFTHHTKSSKLSQPDKCSLKGLKGSLLVKKFLMAIFTQKKKHSCRRMLIYGRAIGMLIQKQ